MLLSLTSNPVGTHILAFSSTGQRTWRVETSAQLRIGLGAHNFTSQSSESPVTNVSTLTDYTSQPELVPRRWPSGSTRQWHLFLLLTSFLLFRSGVREVVLLDSSFISSIQSEYRYPNTP